MGSDAHRGRRYSAIGLRTDVGHISGGMNGRPAGLFSSYNTLAELMAELEPIIVAPWRLGVLAGSRDSASSWQLILTRLFVSYKLHGPIFLMALQDPGFAAYPRLLAGKPS